MLSVFRVTVNKNILSDTCKRLCKVYEINKVKQVAFIHSRSTRIKKPRPPPFPYKEKTIDSIFFDKTMYRMDENSKIITVEGPIAAGKDKFARQLAHEFDMAYMPAPSFDLLYTNDYGADYRSVNSELPLNLQASDYNTFLENPHHPNIGIMQLAAYTLKLSAYAESLLHLLSTGEGVVVNRSHFSDYVFTKAMYQSGYISEKVYNYYLDTLEFSQPLDPDETELLMRPHLVIYLDIPVNLVQQRIKQRARPIEMNSKALTTKFLSDMDKIYKDDYLPKIEEHSHLLMYDWTTEQDMNKIIYDVENISFEHRSSSKKLYDWQFSHLGTVRNARRYVSRENRAVIKSKVLMDCYEIPELYLTADDQDAIDKAREKLPGYTYASGFNADQGDTNLLWKVGHDIYRNFKFPEVESSLYGSKCKQEEKQ